MEPNSETPKFLKVNIEAARFRDLFDIYFSTNIKGSKDYIKLHHVNKKILERTTILFFSVLVQKSLKLYAKVLGLGYKFEVLINILFNGNILAQMLINKLQGKLPMLDKESEAYVSVIGCLDKRVDLDVKPDDSRYFPVLSAMASKIVYENKKFVEAAVKGQWKMELLGSYDFYNDDHKKNTTQALIFHDKHANPDMIIVAFRGTEPFDADAWCTDFDISWLSFPQMGKVHSGFMKALGLQEKDTWPKHIDNDDNPQCHESIKKKLSSLCFGNKDRRFPENSDDKLEDQKLYAYYTIRKVLRIMLNKNSKTKFIVTGHSLGGALAILFPAVLALHNENSILEKLEAVYTFGQPRVGNASFGRYMKKKFNEFDITYNRYVYNNDVVPRVPFDNSVLMFKHFGNCFLYDSHYVYKEITGELYENYFTFSPLAFMKRSMDATGKVVRSLMSPKRESSPLLFIRYLGILFWWAVDHNPQDYVNAVRLGKLPDIED
ncbi:putative triacylglycerol lipase [Heracleum sosnowskyi]|uniref:Triacylglycerol lipase n=1 Tax=Heracleum sosnowskyi TaxID=360622 RepID=A0AAD8IF06_9APIA|nr:putative triacylglycerol lipase [Heracleum sosnowskyi]